MKIAVFNDHLVGIVEGDQLFDVTNAVPGAGPGFPTVYMSRLIQDWAQHKPALEAARRAATSIPVASVKLLAPSPCPMHVLAAPVNYRKHSGEIGARSVSKGKSAADLGFFLKASSSLVGAGESIRLPRNCERRFDHEAELAVIIGRRAKNVPRVQALDYIFGYSCLMDLTMRLEPGVAEEERVARKSFDTFTPLGPWIVTADEVPDPGNLRLQLWVNGEARQDARTSDLILDIPGLIEWASSVMTLQPGDVIATGTPEGVGPIRVGDKVRIEVERIGTMELPVLEADEISPKRF